MASFDLISSSFKEAWAAGAGNLALVAQSRIFFDRAEVADGIAGFPYFEIFVTQESYEVVTIHDAYNSLVSYALRIDAWTCQNQTGGASTGDQLTDQGNIQRALESVLNYIAPNQAWYNVPGFLHCLKGDMSVAKDRELYLGKDVFHSSQTWNLLISE